MRSVSPSLFHKTGWAAREAVIPLLVVTLAELAEEALAPETT